MHHATTNRRLGLAAGVATHLLFVFTVWHLFWFLKEGRGAGSGGQEWGGLGFDIGLAVFFAAPHSVLLLPSVRKSLAKRIPQAFYGLFYTVVTCTSLLVVFGLWQGSEQVVWNLTGPLRLAVQAGFYASWAALFYSLHLTGLGYQTGLTPWLYWARRQQPPRRTFTPRGAYLLWRHPVYLSFMGLVWFTPRMSLDHVVLTAVWTVYLFVGSCLKDQRLAFYLGDSYRAYQATTPGFPLMPFGPLARRPLPEPASSTSDQSPAVAA
ncbi:hypothetical protein Pla123a_30390 [Posidoniimonas polymericola]|uniref:Uncharacterized protein n=1 Tax=Posidoniimonas polymericola TaxID=2528002 RepID=A0A5C5YL54_9BACT|nr:NnrU family protein [Posidoniimonas polymericola]TWT75529.1 hypothetical protein Pla123a_30390 [Posidoniimonas polymericola]